MNITNVLVERKDKKLLYHMDFVVIPGGAFSATNRFMPSDTFTLEPLTQVFSTNYYKGLRPFVTYPAVHLNDTTYRVIADEIVDIPKKLTVKSPKNKTIKELCASHT